MFNTFWVLLVVQVWDKDNKGSFRLVPRSSMESAMAGISPGIRTLGTSLCMARLGSDLWRAVQLLQFCRVQGKLSISERRSKIAAVLMERGVGGRHTSADF